MGGQVVGEDVLVGVGAAQDRRIHRAPQRPLPQGPQAHGQVGGHRCQQGVVEGGGGVEHGEGGAGRPSRLGGGVDPGVGARQHGLVAAVLDGHGQPVASDQRDQGLRLGAGQADGRHASRHPRYPQRLLALQDHLRPVAHGEGAGRHEGRDLAEAVAEAHAGDGAVAVEDGGEGHRPGVDGQLGDVGDGREQLGQARGAVRQQDVGHGGPGVRPGHLVDGRQDVVDLVVARPSGAEGTGRVGALAGEEEDKLAVGHVCTTSVVARPAESRPRGRQ
jgi:hypothetical protein